jgi:ABC-type glycerol-3-phosphate transport system substrate-binding protein
MKLKLALAAAAASACLWSVPAIGQDAPQHIVSLYRAAPGQQVALLKWMARQDQAAVAAGLPASQIYVHTSGDSWDYMVINPVTTKAQDDAVDAAARKMGIASGPRASIEFRTMIGSHTDTTSNGPMTAAQILAQLGEK